MEERLHHILSLVNEWLKFAEGKNAALFAGDLGLMFGITNFIRSNDDLHCVIKLYLLAALAFIFFGTACCLLSFVPRTKIPFLKQKRNPRRKHNFLFYGDISQYDADKYIEALYRICDKDIKEITSIERNYAEQIVVNSRIAMTKYGWFNIAVYLNLSALLTPIMSIFIWLFLRGD
jgi:hypothetical protein